MSEQKDVNSTSKIPSLDGIRGISFLIVFLAHAGLDHVVPGRFGVSIFFLLSGYLITTLLIREQKKTGAISLKLFYARRALRIFPPLYTILAGTLIYLALTHQTAGITVAGVCSQLFYYQNYWWHDGLIPGLGPLWSLAVEEHFYLFFPPLMLLFFSRRMNYRQIAQALCWICLFIFVWRCLVVAFMPEGLRWARDASDTRADAILYGCVLACLEQVPQFRTVLDRKRLERYLVPGCLAVLLATFVIRNPVFRETLRYSLQSVAIAPLLFYLVHFPASLAGRVANSALLGRLGVLSYSLYLVHAVVLVQVTAVIGNALLAGTVSFAMAVLLAMLMQRFIERPTEALRRRLRSETVVQGAGVYRREVMESEMVRASAD